MKKKSFIITAFMGAASLSPSAFADLPPPTPVTEWTEVRIIEDTSPLSEKIDRLATSKGYRTTLKSMMDADQKAGVFTKQSNDLKSYLTLIEGHLNTNITSYTLAAQNGFDDKSANTQSLDQNYKALLNCRDKVQKNSSRYLTFQNVRGCSLESLKEIKQTQKVRSQEVIKTLPPLETITISPLAAPHPLAMKIAAYQSDDPKFRAYQKSVVAARDALVKHDYVGSIYNRDIIRLTDALLNPNVTFDSLEAIPDNGDNSQREFFWVFKESNVVDNNIKLAFECRDTILSDSSSIDIGQRQAQLDEILLCSIDAANKQRSEFKQELSFRAQNIEIDPTEFTEKQKQYESDADIFKGYQQAVRDKADAFTSINYGYYKHYPILWHAMLNKDIGWESFANLKNKDQDDGKDFAWHTPNTISEEERNIKLMFECRGTHVPDDLSQTDMSERRQAFNAVKSCWIDKTVAQNADKLAAKAIADQKKAIMNQKKKEKRQKGMFFGFLALLAGAGGVKGSKVYKNRPKPPKN